MKLVKKIFSGILSAGLTSAGVLGLIFSIFSLASSSNTFSESLASFFLGFGFTLGNWGAAAMLHLRGSEEKISPRLIGAMLLWGVGVFLLGFGGFAAFSPGDRAILENLGFATALCFAPGFFSTLGGIGLFWTERKQNLLAVKTLLQRKQDKRLARAETYTRQIFKLLRRKNISPFLSDKASLQNRLNEWQKHIELLVNRLDDLQSNQLNREDFKDVPQNIKMLKQDLQNETDPKLRQQLQETLESFEAQQRQLTQLEALMRRIDLEIDEGLAAIATIHSQLQLLGSKHSLDSARAERLSSDVEEAASRLDDVLLAMDESYQNAA